MLNMLRAYTGMLWICPECAPVYSDYTLRVYSSIHSQKTFCHGLGILWVRSEYTLPCSEYTLASSEYAHNILQHAEHILTLCSSIFKIHSEHILAYCRYLLPLWASSSSAQTRLHSEYASSIVEHTHGLLREDLKKTRTYLHYIGPYSENLLSALWKNRRHMLEYNQRTLIKR